jgi:branched-chain amino acid transport system ATP-binding protein
MPIRAYARLTSEQKKMLLEARSLSVRYGAVQAVRAASLSVDEGEIVAVLGANGAGKSSLLKGIFGLVPCAGKITFQGSHSVRERIAAGMVLVPEGRGIVMSLTVDENLLMGAYSRRDARAVRAEIESLYERFPNLGARRDLPASVLSGGEQQMLAIGRGILARPRLMLLDEPSLGLSPLLVQQVFRLLKELNRDGLALLLVEQNTRQALAIAARAYVMELGVIVMEGAPEKLLSDPRLVDAYLGGRRKQSTPREESRP